MGVGSGAGVCVGCALVASIGVSALPLNRLVGRRGGGDSSSELEGWTDIGQYQLLEGDRDPSE